MGGKRFFSGRIKFAGARVPLDRSIEPLRVECLEPGAKPRQFAPRKLLDSLFEVFGGGHLVSIAFAAYAEKAAANR